MKRITLLAVLGLGVSTPIAARELAAADAPARWVRYAEQATVAVSGMVRSDNPGAVRVRAALGQAIGQSATGGATIPVKLWIAADGTISRIALASSPGPEVESGLRDLIVGQRLPARPPRGMTLPLRIMLDVAPGPAGQ